MRVTFRKLPRLTVAKMMGAVALMALPIAFVVVPLHRMTEWRQLEREIDVTIRHLQPTNPQEVNMTVWECAQSTTVTTYCNICYSPGHPSTAEMYRLRYDLRLKLKEKVDLDTLEWVRDRLARTGPHGKWYIDHFKPLYIQCFPTNTAPPSPTKRPLPSPLPIDRLAVP